jgi:ubiquinone/menaquinone biosynthesis C-methylase UbiE
MQLEGIRTRKLLARFLPAALAAIIDVGGGAGVYAIPLSGEGYAVHLVDPVALHVRQAVEDSVRAGAPLASATVGDARRLEFPDASFDAACCSVLCTTRRSAAIG